MPSGSSLYFEDRHVISLEETNAVGNVYFARYLSWQGRCRELFLREKCPEILAQVAQGTLHLVTREVSCRYEVELFAGDVVSVRLRLKRHTHTRIWLAFEYVRVAGDVETTVATGDHTIACLVQPDRARPPTPAELPDALVAAFAPYLA